MFQIHYIYLMKIEFYNKNFLMQKLIIKYYKENMINYMKIFVKLYKIKIMLKNNLFKHNNY